MKKYHISTLLKKTAGKGRRGDSMLAHLTPKASKTLKKFGGSGTTNPKTGLKEYFGPLEAAALAASGINAVGGVMTRKNDREFAAHAARRKAEMDADRLARATETNTGRDIADQSSLYNKHMNSKAGDLPPQILMQEAAKLLAKDKAQLAISDRPIYKGPTSAAKSPLTTRSENLTNQYMSQGAPRAAQINTALTRPNSGFSPAKSAEAVDFLRGNQQKIASQVALPTLQGQFGSSYEPRRQNFEKSTSNAIGDTLKESNDSLGKVSSASRDIEGKKNATLVELLQAIQSGDIGRQKALTNSLTTLGKEHQAHGNLMVDTMRGDFENQASAPQRKADKLQAALDSYRGILSDEGHPDLQKPYGQALAKDLESYGIDLANPVKDWGDQSKRTASPLFKGQRVAPLPYETTSSYSMANALEPNFENANTPEKNRLLESLLSSSSLGDQAVSGAPELMRGKASNLVLDAQKRLAKDQSALTNKHLTRGQYGMPSHVAELEQRARDITQGAGEETGKDYMNALSSKLNSLSNKDATDMGQIARLAKQEHNEFGQALDSIMGLNQVGENKWKAKQEENDNEYKNFTNESNYRWPVAYGQIAGSAFNEGRAGNQGVINALQGRLADANSRYSDLNNQNTLALQEIEGLRTPINSAASAQAATQDANLNPRAHIDPSTASLYNPNESSAQLMQRILNVNNPADFRGTNSPNALPIEQMTAIGEAARKEHAMMQNGDFRFMLNPGETVVDLYNRVKDLPFTPENSFLNNINTTLRAALHNPNSAEARAYLPNGLMNPQRVQEQFQQQETRRGVEAQESQARAQAARHQALLDQDFTRQGYPVGFTPERIRAAGALQSIDPAWYLPDAEYNAAPVGTYNFNNPRQPMSALYRQIAGAQRDNRYMGVGTNGRHWFSSNPLLS
jgi:hypothetical protein